LFTSCDVEMVHEVCQGAYAGARRYKDMIWYTVANGRE
jgi:hypothetical protein